MDYIQLQGIKLLKIVLNFTGILRAKKAKRLRTNVNDDKNLVDVFKNHLVYGVNMEPFPSLRTSVIH